MGITTAPVDEAKLNDFLGQMVGDLGAAANAPRMVIGDKLDPAQDRVNFGPTGTMVRGV